MAREIVGIGRPLHHITGQAMADTVALPSSAAMALTRPRVLGWSARQVANS